MSAMTESVLNGVQITSVPTNITGTSLTQIIAAQGTGRQISLHQLLVQNHHASQSTKVTFYSDASGTTSLFTICAGVGDLGATFPCHGYRLPANSPLYAKCSDSADVFVNYVASYWG